MHPPVKFTRSGTLFDQNRSPDRVGIRLLNDPRSPGRSAVVAELPVHLRLVVLIVGEGEALDFAATRGNVPSSLERERVIHSGADTGAPAAPGPRAPAAGRRPGTRRAVGVGLVRDW